MTLHPFERAYNENLQKGMTRAEAMRAAVDQSPEIHRIWANQSEPKLRTDTTAGGRDFKTLVEAIIRYRGCSMREAIRQAANTWPEAHRRGLAAVNASARKDRQ